MEDEAPSSLLVFQCKACRNIVGDSLSFVSAEEASRTLTLAGGLLLGILPLILLQLPAGS
jgi:hypothetical protein